ncbi:MAG: hypothetical protein ACI3YQ_08555 [Prevotella sp.]
MNDEHRLVYSVSNPLLLGGARYG